MATKVERILKSNGVSTKRCPDGRLLALDIYVNGKVVWSIWQDATLWTSEYAMQWLGY